MTESNTTDTSDLEAGQHRFEVTIAGPFGAPSVYAILDRHGNAIYIGNASNSIHGRLRSRDRSENRQSLAWRLSQAPFGSGLVGEADSFLEDGHVYSNTSFTQDNITVPPRFAAPNECLLQGTTGHLAVDATCAVCLDSVHDHIYRLECGHRFHLDCINLWVSRNNTCPICRQCIYDQESPICETSEELPALLAEEAELDAVSVDSFTQHANAST